MLDIGTFGKTPAAQKLVEIINERNIDSKGISNILTTYNKYLNFLNKLEGPEKIYMAQLLYDKSSEKLQKVHEDVRSYVKNVLNTTHKFWLRKNSKNISKS